MQARASKISKQLLLQAEQSDGTKSCILASSNFPILPLDAQFFFSKLRKLKARDVGGGGKEEHTEHY